MPFATAAPPRSPTEEDAMAEETTTGAALIAELNDLG
jgi:hypothetical protein